MSLRPFARWIPPQTLRRISHRLEYAALLVVAALLGALGVDRASAFMGRMWRLFAPFNKRHARVEAHLAAAMPELDAETRHRIVLDMWENLGRTAAETILLPRLLREPERFEWDLPPGTLEKARGGAIFVSLHTGNWEVVSVPLARAGLDLHAVYKPLRNPWVETWLADRRRALYASGLMPLDRSVAVKLRSLARAGSTLAILADLRDDTSIPIEFFGLRAGATPFPALLARRLHLPLFAGRTIRTHGAHFRLDGHWIDVPETADAAADVEATTRAVHAVFEGWIREHPEQWMWAHRKWL